LEGRGEEMRRMSVAIVGGTLLAAIVVPSAGSASPSSFRVQGVFVSAECQGDKVEVILTVTQEGGVGTVLYRWDFLHRGSYDTKAKENPMARHLYDPGLFYSPRVGASDEAGKRDTDLVYFETPSCE
jgi:hypothetical protein